MTATNGELVEQVRQAITTARQAGQPTPGRPTLVRLTGATDHAVRRALANLAAEQVNAGEPGSAHARESGTSLPDAPGTDAQPDATGGEPGDPTSPAPHQRPNIAPKPPAPAGRPTAWAGFVFGSFMSIAANILHAWLPTAHEPAGWRPGIPPQIGAAVWPIGLMIAIEALWRIRWPKGLGWGIARFGGAGTVAVGSAIISYGHLRDVLLAWSYSPMAAAVGPLVLDGLMAVCGFALLAMSRTSAGEAGDSDR